MKTTDLIPIILYQLVDGDRYGYEIIKQIEDSSNGGIIIKQPTLYSVLKKLEQGRFISSYWQDSEIGGKRHYYKLTDNGKSQLDTYPAYQQLLKDVLGETEDISIESKISSIDVLPSVKEDKKDITYPDTIVKEETNNVPSSEIEPIKIEPIDLTMPNEDIVQFSSIDLNDDTPSFNVQTENEVPKTSYVNIFDAIDYDTEPVDEEYISPIINEQPCVIEDNIDAEQVIKDNDIEDAPKFTEKVQIIEPVYVENKLYEQLSPSSELIEDIKQDENITDIDACDMAPIEEVKYLRYVDLKTDKTSIKRRKSIVKRVQKMAISCLSMLLILIGGILLCNKYSYGKLFYISAIIVGGIVLLYPIILLGNLSKIRLKYCSKPFTYSISRDFFVKLSIFLSMVIAIFAYNLTITLDITSIFKLSNCGNFIAPLILSVPIMLDFIYSAVLYKNYSK